MDSLIISLLTTTKQNNMFTEKFDDYAITGESISCTIGDTTYTARISHDDYYHIDDDDMHNEDQSVTGCDDETHAKAMEARAEWFRSGWFYGVLTLTAERDGWTKYYGSLGGIEINYPAGDNNYLTESANELLAEIAN